MRVLKTEDFCEWAASEQLADKQLLDVVNDMEKGLAGTALGSSIYKKRMPLPGRGKQGGARTLIAYRAGTFAVFLVGFSKGERANVSRKELAALRQIAKEMLAYSEHGWERAIRSGTLIEVMEND